MNHSEDKDYQDYLKQKRETEEYYEGLESVRLAQEHLDKKNRVNNLLDSIREFNPEALLADGLENALVGYSTKGYAIYSVSKIIQILMERDSMSREEAIEFFDFNIDGAYMGEYTPIYIHEE